MRARIAAALPAVAACLLVAGPATGAERCPGGFACSDVAVPLDRTDPQSPTLTLRVARHRASAGAGKPALVALTGGPGQSALPFAHQYARSLRAGLHRYQLVMFDQRGTGASGVLDCPQAQKVGDFPTLERAQDAAARCGASLGETAGDYSTAATVEDIEAVRRAVGADKIALAGVSYGTHVIQRYLLAHPDRVDRIVLDSTVAPGGVDQFQLDSYAAVPRVLRELAGPRAVAETGRLVAQLGQGVYRGTAYGRGGRPRTVTVRGAGDLFNLFLAGDLDELQRSQFAAAVHSALRGDRLPLMRLFVLARAEATYPIRDISMGLYHATTCTDVRMPWAPDSAPQSRGPLFDAAVGALAGAPLAPFDVAAARATSISGACVGWPAVATGPDDVPSAYAAVPALILAGLSDVRTPVESARRVAALIPGSRLVTVPGTGHDVIDADTTGCVRRALSRFLRGRAPARGACRRSNGLNRAHEAFPLRLKDLEAVGDGPARAGRVLSAALRTADDAERLANTARSDTMRRGGLRGGWMRGRFDAAGLSLDLHRYVYLPGLSVSGTLRLRDRATGRLRVSGIARGTVAFRRGGVTAVIDGHRLVLGG